MGACLEPETSSKRARSPKCPFTLGGGEGRLLKGTGYSPTASRSGFYPPQLLSQGLALAPTKSPERLFSRLTALPQLLSQGCWEVLDLRIWKDDPLLVRNSLRPVPNKKERADGHTLAAVLSRAKDPFVRCRTLSILGFYGLCTRLPSLLNWYSNWVSCLLPLGRWSQLLIPPKEPISVKQTHCTSSTYSQSLPRPHMCFPPRLLQSLQAFQMVRTPAQEHPLSAPDMNAKY